MIDKIHNHYYPVVTDSMIEITGMEYFGPEQNYEDLNTIVNLDLDSYHIVGKFNGMWDGELNDIVKTCVKVLYCDRPEFKDYLYETKNFDSFPILKKMPEIMGFEPGQFNAQLQMQRPGCLISKHYDPDTIFGPWINKVDRCIRVLVALAPWEYGQLLGFNNKILTNWNQGDIIYTDFKNTWHYTANCSWHSRPLLQISGVANDNLLGLVKNQQHKIFQIS